MKKILFMLIGLIGGSAHAAEPRNDLAEQFAREFGMAQHLADEFGAQAKKLNPKSQLSAKAGRAFYTRKVFINDKNMSCSACHTDDPRSSGTHVETGKPIKPIAISANPESFSDRRKVEKNFVKHCRDLYNKDCSAQDKGDYLTYLLTIK